MAAGKARKKKGFRASRKRNMIDICHWSSGRVHTKSKGRSGRRQASGKENVIRY